MSHGPAGVAVFATSSAQKFTSTAIEVLSDIVPGLRSVCEIRLLRRTEATLLDTYVGRETGRRVLDGHIRRGDVETLRAALFLCDLRDFTALSNQLPPEQILNRLNLYFDQVVPAITAERGEILKFMGAMQCLPSFIATRVRRTAAARLSLPPVRRYPESAQFPTPECLCMQALHGTTAKLLTATSAPKGG